MNIQDQHQRARLLLEERAFGLISDGDAQWLAAHLAECEACSQADGEMRAAIALLRSEPVTAPTFLVSRTRIGVRIRARELHENAQRMKMLWLSVALAVVFSSTTFYGGLLLYMDGWATLSNTTSLLSAVAVVWFWFAPAVLLVAATMYRKGEWPRVLQENSLGRGLGND